MPIVYKIDVLKELSEKGYSTYRLRKENILSQSTIKCLKEKQSVSFDTLAKICEILDLQPSDIIEYNPNVTDLMKEKPAFSKILMSKVQEYFQDEEGQKNFEQWYQNKYGNNQSK